MQCIGVSLGDSLQFWKEAFHPNKTAEEFEKHYAYNIRHNYGKEGTNAKRNLCLLCYIGGNKNYAPYSCTKIINKSPGVGEHHGCPFKTLAEAELNQHLDQMQVPTG